MDGDKTNALEEEEEEDDDDDPEVVEGVAQLPPFEPYDIAAEAVAVATGATPRKNKRKATNVDEGGKGKKTKKSPAAAKGAPPAPTVISFQADPSLTNQNKKDGMPPWRKIQDMLLTEESATLAMIQRGILQVPSICPKCDQTLRFPKKGSIMRCSRCYSRNGGEWSQSLYKGTFFEFGRMKRQDVLMFLYHWLCGAKHKQLCLVMGWSNSTMFRWTTLVQELVATVTFYENYNPFPKKRTPDEQAAMEATIVKIGGHDVLVQIDDCPFDKRYCAHPDYVKDGWIFCGIEVTPKHRFFSCVVEDRSLNKFMVLARKYILPGSIIRSTRWTATDIIDIQANAQYRLERIGYGITPLHPNHIPFDQPFDNPFQHAHNPLHPYPPHIMQQQPPLPQPPPQLQLPQNQLYQPLEGEIWIVPDDTNINAPLGAINLTSPSRKHNNVKELQGSLFEFIWRKQHDTNLWNGILWTLKQVMYTTDELV